MTCKVTSSGNPFKCSDSPRLSFQMTGEIQVSNFDSSEKYTAYCKAVASFVLQPVPINYVTEGQESLKITDK